MDRRLVSDTDDRNVDSVHVGSVAEVCSGKELLKKLGHGRESHVSQPKSYNLARGQL